MSSKLVGLVDQTEHSGGADEPLTDTHQARRASILVIDDEPLISNAVRRSLAREHEVLVVLDAREALAHIEQGARFDLILCDIHMPKMDGSDLHARLLLIAPEQATRMVFLTGGAFTSYGREFLARVPNACIEKPFDAQRLRILVTEHLRASNAV
jgi:CheY-like chemotaxis protein